MSSFMGIEANNTITSAINGLRNSSRQMQSAAKTVAAESIRGASEASASSPSGSSSSRMDYVRSLRDTVTLSEFDRPQGMESALISTMEAGTTYTSSARVVQSVDEMMGTMLDTYV